MNEQLIVKNFGPIKDATVDFKRVTVFIGPTGGGKSTLAKLKDIFLYRANYHIEPNSAPLYKRFDSLAAYYEHSLANYFTDNTFIDYQSPSVGVKYNEGVHSISLDWLTIPPVVTREELRLTLEEAKKYAETQQEGVVNDDTKIITSKLEDIVRKLKRAGTTERIHEDFPIIAAPTKPWYCPSERVFVSALEYSWAGLLRDDIGLPKNILDFANNFSIFRKKILKLYIEFLDVTYLHRNGQDFIKIPESETLFRLYETASGIQSVTPLLVLLEHLSRNTEQAQSFIIEEPELNLYPTAQQGLLNWLVEKCTKGENDLTITTHSPYILSHLNLLLYAYQVAEKHPDRREAVAAIVPEASWINPKEFACYHVEGGGVKSLVDEELGLIDNNELDNISGDKADAFDQLISINRGF